MFWFVDTWIEQTIKQGLHNQRDQIINRTIAAFEKLHKNLPTTELKKKLENEAVRIYAIVDRSILRDRVKRAKYTFWAVAIAGIILVAMLGVFYNETLDAFRFATPLVMAGVSWVVSLATIPISYNQRVKGAMDSVVLVHENSLPLQTEMQDVLNLDGQLIQSQTYIQKCLKCGECIYNSESACLNEHASQGLNSYGTFEPNFSLENPVLDIALSEISPIQNVQENTYNRQI